MRKPPSPRGWRWNRLEAEKRSRRLVLRIRHQPYDDHYGDKALGVAKRPGLVSFGEDALGRLHVQRSGGVFRIVDG